MIKKNNKEKALDELRKNKIEYIFNIVPNLSDKVMDFVEENYNITEIINKTFDEKKKYDTNLSGALLLLSGVQARMKQQHSISELNLALTCKKIIENLNVNIAYDTNETLLKESNVRAWLKKYEQEEIKELKAQNKEINLDDINFKYNNYLINYFNQFTEEFIKVTNTTCNIHIWDCSILDVNIDNNNYEGSTITQKGGKKLNGYKIGSLRGVTNDGGITEEICMSTAKTHDLEMSEDLLKKSNRLRNGDYLLMDRGFLDIKFFRELTKKGINIIIPVKKNMNIYQEAVKSAIENNCWIKHPNSKRKGQNICLVDALEMTWLPENENSKKPSKINLDYKINACVIRFEIDKNKDVLSDDDIISSDEKYAYACIITNDTSLGCSDIIRMYEMRSEIEEDYRQLKDFWGLNTYKSTQYHIVSFVILVSLLGYNFYQIYKESEEGKDYIGKNFIVEERRGLYIVKGVRFAIVTEHYFGIFELQEILDIYSELSTEQKKVFKQYLED